MPPPVLLGVVGAFALLAVTDLALGLDPVDWWSTAGGISAGRLILALRSVNH